MTGSSLRPRKWTFVHWTSSLLICPPGAPVTLLPLRSKRIHLRLILAKNGCPTSQDIVSTENFLAAMKNAVNWVDLTPFSSNTEDNVPCHTTPSIENSRHISPNRRKESSRRRVPQISHISEFYEQAPPSFQHMPEDAIKQCSDLLASAIDDSTYSYGRWVKLVVVSGVLKRSRILSELRYQSERMAAARRKLGRVCQYTI